MGWDMQSLPIKAWNERMKRSGGYDRREGGVTPDNERVPSSETGL
jgi:hypothetical protein